MEAFSTIDMLDDAGLVSYLGDGGIDVNPRPSTAFYHYLRNLYRLLSGVDSSMHGDPLS